MKKGISQTLFNRRSKSNARRSRRTVRRKALMPVLLLGLTLPLIQTTQAAEIYYARAIGHEFLPEPAPANPTPKPTTKTDSALPALGETTEHQEPPPSEGMSRWSKILIGVVVVGAIAALGNRGGGGSNSESNSGGGTDTSGASTPPPSSPPPPTGSGGGSGGGISIGIGGGKR